MAGTDASGSTHDRATEPDTAGDPNPGAAGTPRRTVAGQEVDDPYRARPPGTRFIFIDTETTGLDFARHQLTEVAWIVRFEDGREETRCVVPEHTLDGADEQALQLTHYHERIAPQRRSPASEWLVQFLADAEGAVLVGAVPDFDARHLERAAARIQRAPTWDHHLLDVETLALPLISPGPEAPRSLAKTCRALGIPHDKEQAHGALYDARQAMRVFDRVYELLAALRSSGAPLPPPVPRNGHTGTRERSEPGPPAAPPLAAPAPPLEPHPDQPPTAQPPPDQRRPISHALARAAPPRPCRALHRWPARWPTARPRAAASASPGAAGSRRRQPAHVAGHAHAPGSGGAGTGATAP
jgi:DNA polymerase III epsilon subunit-like protein